MKLGSILRFAIALVTHVAEVVGMVLLCLMVLVVSFICFTRYALHFTPAWGEELALLCMVWFGFMAIALGVRDDSHIGVTIFDKFYPPVVLRGLNVFKYICLIGFGIFMTLEGNNMAKGGSWNRMPGLGITSYWMYIIVAASGIAIIVYSIDKLADHARNKNVVPLNVEEA